MLGALLVLVLAQAHWTASATVEPRRETLRYRFDNPSSFDTVELVPHFFEQTSQIHRIDVFTTGTPDKPAGFSGTVTVAPVARGRLQVELPDKYPGREIVFDALGSIVDLEGTFTASAGRFAVGGGLRVSRAFSWRRTAQMHLPSVSLLFLIGTR